MYKNMRDYTHEEFIELIKNMEEVELLKFSANYGGYPVLFRMALDERVKNIPFIQTGAAVIVKYKDGILLQARTDRDMWGLLGGCQELGERLEDTAIRELYEETNLKVSEEELIEIGTISGSDNRNYYPNGDIVYNNATIFVVEITENMLSHIKPDSESKELKFFTKSELPKEIMDLKAIELYLRRNL